MGMPGILPFLQQYLQQAQAPPPPPGAQQGPPAQAPAPAQPPQVAQPDQSAQPNVAPPPVPQQTKGHKLMQILQGGLVGALDGVAQNAQTYAQTGRNAGFGGGVGGAIEAPLQRAQQWAQTAQTQTQTGMIKSEQEPINIPGYGPMPGWLAKSMGPKWIQAQAAMDVENKKSQTSKDVQGMKGQQSLAVAQEKNHFMPVAGVGLIDTKQLDANGKPTLIPDSAEGFKLTQDHIDSFGLPQELLGHNMTATQLSQWERAKNQGVTIVQGAAGPASFDKQTGETKNLGLGNPGMGRPMEIADPANQAQTIVTTGAGAQGKAGKGSASLAVAKKGAEAEMPTKIGDQKVAFTTMIQHADLLRRAAKALNNGDMQSLSGLENAFKNEFGYSGPITSAAIADAYKGEVSNVINKGHITDTGNEKIAHTLDPTKQNYQTIDSVLGAYQSLAQSKMNMLNQQKQNAITQSQPNKPGAKTLPANDPLGIR